MNDYRILKMSDRDPAFVLQACDVHFWDIDLDGEGQDCQPLKMQLSKDEIFHSEQFHHEIDSKRFINRRWVLRQLLGKYTGIPPEKLEYEKNASGKLSLPFQRIRFNLSSRGNKVVLAFTLDKEIGVDVEQIVALPEINSMAKRWLSETEYSRWIALPSGKQVEAFYHAWTQKEAFVKAQGDGMSIPFRDFSVAVDPDLPGGIISAKRNIDVTSWKMITRKMIPDWRVSVCLRSGSDNVHLQVFSSRLSFFV